MKEPGINWDLTRGTAGMLLWGLVGAMVALIAFSLAAVVGVWWELKG